MAHQPPGPPAGLPDPAQQERAYAAHHVPVVQARSTSGAAVVALIFGGHVGVAATRQGRGMAVAGLVLGYLVVAVTVLVVAVAPQSVGRMLGDLGTSLVDFFENLVGFVGGPFA